MKTSIEKGNISAIYELFDYYVNCAPNLITAYFSQYSELLIATTNNSEKLNEIARTKG